MLNPVRNDASNVELDSSGCHVPVSPAADARVAHSVPAAARPPMLPVYDVDETKIVSASVVVLHDGLYAIGVCVGVKVGVQVGVTVDVGECVGVAEGVRVGVLVGVSVAVHV